jgi:hypothetical protein
MTVPSIQPRVSFLHEPATMDLPVFPNGMVYETDCTCDVRQEGRTMIDGRWVKVCMRCGSLRYATGT